MTDPTDTTQPPTRNSDTLAKVMIVSALLGALVGLIVFACLAPDIFGYCIAGGIALGIFFSGMRKPCKTTRSTSITVKRSN